MTHRTLISIAFALTLSACKKQVPTQAVAPMEPAPVAAAAQTPAHVQELVGNFQRVYFDTDSNTLSDDAKDALRSNASIMTKHTDIRVEVQGHADERGTTDYNMALGQKRAKAVVGYLNAEGVGPSRLVTISFGEEKPASSGSGEVAWSKNRRAEFRITWAEDAKAQGTTE